MIPEESMMLFVCVSGVMAAVSLSITESFKKAYLKWQTLSKEDLEMGQ